MDKKEYIIPIFLPVNLFKTFIPVFENLSLPFCIIEMQICSEFYIFNRLTPLISHRLIEHYYKMCLKQKDISSMLE